MVTTRPDGRSARDRTRHDFVLAGIGVALALAIVVGLATAVPFRVAFAAAAPVAAGLVADALFFNPPRPPRSPVTDEGAGGERTGGRERIGAD